MSYEEFEEKKAELPGPPAHRLRAPPGGHPRAAGSTCPPLPETT